MACAFMRNKCGSTGFKGCRCPPEVRATAPEENRKEFETRVKDLRYRLEFLVQDSLALESLDGPTDPRRETTQSRMWQSLKSVQDALRKLEGEFFTQD